MEKMFSYGYSLVIDKYLFSKQILNIVISLVTENRKS